MRPLPLWATALIRCVAPEDQAEAVLGDLVEARCVRLQRHRRTAADVLFAFDALDMTAALVRTRVLAFRTNRGNSVLQDYKLGFRMLVKYPGLTVAGGLALAIAIGVGAGWYDLAGDLFRPAIPLPNGDRIVEVEMRDAASAGDERRILHDFVAWRDEARSIRELGAYRTLERNLIPDGARPSLVTVAETTASAFRVAGVPPLHGRPLIDADERPGAPPVVVLGYDVWRQRFGGRMDAIGQTIRLGRTMTTIVGIMPEGFAFPISHRLWIPLQIRPAGYAPLEGPAVRLFALLAPGSTQADANVELTAITDRRRAASPETHQHLRPRVLAYGGESPGDRDLLEKLITHLPVFLVLVVACANVGTLMYARTATRDAEIATRYALGASRGRIIGQLFIEALVFASLAAVVGLAAAHWALQWGFAAYLSGAGQDVPFWLRPGLKLRTILYATGLTVGGAAILGILPAFKATGAHVQSQLRNLGSGGSTLRFGSIWTAVMIFQVALAVICIPPAMGISHEALRDRQVRERFPAEQYLAARVTLDRETAPGASSDESEEAFGAQFAATYRELERRLAQEPVVVAVTFGNRLPGMSPSVRGAEVEASPGAEPIRAASLWTTAIGPRYFGAFDRSIVAGRGFHDGDRASAANTVIVNEAFARRFLHGESPVGRRLRYADAARAKTEPWLEIIGMVQDMGMTPTDLGEAPYVYHPASAATAHPVVMGVRLSGDPAAFAPRVRAIAADVDPGLRLDDVRTLDDLAWRQDLPNLVGAGAIASVVALGIFLSAAGIFSLMSVSVARRTREIGLRAALGAGPRRLLGSIFSRALVLVGSGIVLGNLVLVLFIWIEPEAELPDVYGALILTSAVILTAGLLACAEPARRALRIQPTDALKDA